ncbi:unnamed protein product [Phytomonas sp. EM1]|nr:unnamed protein product [Phytomonas sp. EM1]|eukprot:CCW64533.1 unnamed protein product [Phytomonas sp. isolate EM1]
MLRVCRIVLSHYEMGLKCGNMHYRTRGPGILRRCWRRFKAQPPLRKFFLFCGCGVFTGVSYISLCVAIHRLHQPTIYSLYHPTEDYLVEDWRDVEPGLKPGDILLMRGTSPLSWMIVTGQFIYSMLHPAALRYSHVAVVTESAILSDDDGATPDAGDGKLAKSPAAAGYDVSKPPARNAVEALLRDEQEAGQRRRQARVKRGAIILEGMDNTDCHVPDINGKVHYNAVQRVEATKRLCSVDEDGKPSYHYFAVRRLKRESETNDEDKDGERCAQEDLPRTPAMLRAIRGFAERNEGRPLICSLVYPLAFVSPRLYLAIRRQDALHEVSCAQLIVDLYQELGLIQRRWRWVPLSDQEAALSHKGEASLSHWDTHLRVSADRHPAAYVVGRGPHVHERASRWDPPLRQGPLWAHGLPVVPPNTPIEGAEMLLEEPTTCDPLTGGEMASPPLRAGDLARCRVKRPIWKLLPLRGAGSTSWCQLRWYYRHNSLQTAPYALTQGAGEKVLDWAPGCGGLGSEIRMGIPSETIPSDHEDEISTPPLEEGLLSDSR